MTWLKNLRKETPASPRQSASWPLWHPFNGLDRLFEEMNHLSRTFPEFEGVWGRESVPKLDILESETQLEIHVELPGVEPEKVELSMADGVLTVRGSFEQSEQHQKASASVQERRYGSFERSVSLPDYADLDKASAQFKNGLLTVTLPKKAEVVQKSRRIPVHVV
jgi:HSP20 family protein